MAIEKTDIQTDAQMKSYAEDEMSIARQTRDWLTEISSHDVVNPWGQMQT